MEVSELHIEQAEREPGNIVFSQDSDFVNPNGYSWIQTGTVYQKFIFSGDFLSFKSRMCSTAGFQPLPQVTLFKNMYKTNDGEVKNVFSIIRMMRSGVLKPDTEDILRSQAAGNIELKRTLKSALPCFSHSGTFMPRENAGLILPSFTYQLDIDGLSNAREVLAQITADRNIEILFVSVSPSGNGIKGLLFLREIMMLQDEWTYQEYRNAYHQATAILFDYFQKNHGVKIDTQMKAISQPFYLFHAPDMFIHKNLISWV